MTRGKTADRIRLGGISGKHKGLTSAAAEIDLLSSATAARLEHPIVTAKCVQPRRLAPDLRQRAVAHRLETQAGNHLGSMAWQYFTLRIDAHVAAAPSAHAWLRHA